MRSIRKPSVCGGATPSPILPRGAGLRAAGVGGQVQHRGDPLTESGTPPPPLPPSPPHTRLMSHSWRHVLLSVRVVAFSWLGVTSSM